MSNGALSFGTPGTYTFIYLTYQQYTYLNNTKVESVAVELQTIPFTQGSVGKHLSTFTDPSAVDFEIHIPRFQITQVVEKWEYDYTVVLGALAVHSVFAQQLLLCGCGIIYNGNEMRNQEKRFQFV